MKIKLEYTYATESKEAIAWLRNAEKRLNEEIQKKMDDYATFGVSAKYVAGNSTDG